eukprot:6213957-Pleurochrysis_carterae.AAC.1
MSTKAANQTSLTGHCYKVGLEPLLVLSTPVTELFDAWAVAEAVDTALRGASRTAVIAVGDCDPAAAALNSASSNAAVAGGTVPREANGDANRLSHLYLLGAVTADVEAAGWRAARVRILQQCWEALCRATHIGDQETTERDGCIAGAPCAPAEGAGDQGPASQPAPLPIHPLPHPVFLPHGLSPMIRCTAGSGIASQHSEKE